MKEIKIFSDLSFSFYYLIYLSSLFVSEKDMKKRMKAIYGENKEIIGDYNKDLSVKCNKGIFVGKLENDVLSFKGIPYAKPPIDNLRSNFSKG